MIVDGVVNLRALPLIEWGQPRIGQDKLFMVVVVVVVGGGVISHTSRSLMVHHESHDCCLESGDVGVVLEEDA